MRVNSKVFTERMDMLGDIQIPTCPTIKIAGYSLRTVCENIVTMLMKLGYAFPDYHKMTELDKKLMLAYWKEYDGLALLDVLEKSFDSWFINHATPPETLRRAREWLASHNYVIINEEVQRHALQAGENTRRGVNSARL